MFPLSPVGTARAKNPVAVGIPTGPYDGLGFRSVRAGASSAAPTMRELAGRLIVPGLRTVWPLLIVAAVCGLAGYYAAANGRRSAPQSPWTATKFEFSAPEIRVRRGQPVTLELTALRLRARLLVARLQRPGGPDSGEESGGNLHAGPHRALRLSLR
jgi:hypothetical protein